METVQLRSNIADLTQLMSELEEILEKINSFELKIYSVDPVGQELIHQQ